jgi:hypothetical protein
MHRRASIHFIVGGRSARVVAAGERALPGKFAVRIVTKTSLLRERLCVFRSFAVFSDGFILDGMNLT